MAVHDATLITTALKTSAGVAARALAIELVEAEFKNYLGVIAPKAELMEALGEMIARVSEDREVVMKSSRARVRGILDGLSRELQELIRMRAQSLITDEEFQNQRSLLSERRVASDVAPLVGSLNTKEIRQQLNEITSPLKDILRTWSDLTVFRRHRFQRLIFPVGFVTGNIQTAELGLIFRTLGGLSRGESNGVPPTFDSWNQIIAEIQGFWKVIKDIPEEEDVVKIGVRRKTRK